MRCGKNETHVKRSFKSLKFQSSYTDDLPILHPTENTCKADIWLKVSKLGVPEARIPLHKDHICENIPYFNKMMNNPGFRESSIQEIDFESGYSAELICDYLSSVYSQTMNLTDINCVDFCCLADFLGDESGMEACRTYLTTFGDQLAILQILLKTRSYDSVCMEIIQKQRLRTDEPNITLISCLPYKAFSKILDKEIIKTISRSTELSIIKAWLKTNPFDIYYKRFILKKEFSAFDTSSKLKFYGDLMGQMSHEMSQQVYKHMFDEKEKERRIKREAPDDNSNNIKSRRYDDDHAVDRDGLYKYRSQTVEITRAGDKYNGLQSVLELHMPDIPNKTIIIFCWTSIECDRLAANLVRDSWPVCVAYFGQDEQEQAQVLNDFGSVVPILITTSLFCLTDPDGNFLLDDVALVVNYDCPESIDEYTSRLEIGKDRAWIHTMMTDQDSGHSEYIIDVLKKAHQFVPYALKTMAERERRHGR